MNLILAKKVFKSLFFKNKNFISQYYDVVLSGNQKMSLIKGGGPVGLALSCALSHHEYFKSGEKKILLID